MKRFKKPTRRINLTLYPYATQHGTLDVPTSITDEDKIQKYISEHFSEIKLSKVELDYKGTDVDFYEE